jgi:predicted Zn-dependent protease with MMP-like domain
MPYETLNEIEWENVQRIWDLLDQGEVERARIETDALLRKRPGHPDVRIVDAAVSLDEAEPGHALEALQGAETSADPALFFHLRAAAQYDLARFEPAREDGERAIAVRPEMADTHDLLSRTFEYLGDAEQASEHAEEAERLDPAAYPHPLDVGTAEFDTVVEESLAEMHPDIRRHLEEFPVLVDTLPRREILTAEEPPLSPDLLGLFVGRHLMERSVTDLPSAPGAIYLFRRNLLRWCRDREELKREIRITVQHEIGHLLGLDEKDLEDRGLA